MTEKNYESFEKSAECQICQKRYNEDVKVKVNCHIIRKYRGSAHKGCNLNLSLTKKVSPVFHNLGNYDSYLISRTWRI